LGAERNQEIEKTPRTLGKGVKRARKCEGKGQVFRAAPGFLRKGQIEMERKGKNGRV